MEDTPSKTKGWTDTEKIISLAGKIPWDVLALPEGRTLKACQVMIDKEKQKIKKAAPKTDEKGEADGGDNDDEGTKAKGKKAPAKKGTAKKRKSGDDDDEEAFTPSKKGRKAPAKKVVKAGVDDGSPEAPVKAEDEAGDEEA